MNLAIARLRKALRPLKRLIPQRPGPAILMYHRVGNEAFDPWGMAVTPANFSSQIEWLSANRPVLGLDEFVAAHRERRLPEDAVAITFDDGYACTFGIAENILQKAGLSATVFLAPAWVDRGGEFWWDELERIVAETDAEMLIVRDTSVKLGQKTRADARWSPYDPPHTSRQKAYRTLWSMLHPLSPRDLDAAMDELRGQANVTETRDTHRVATWEEIQASSSFTYGSHGLHHASLPALQRRDQASEIEDGRSALVSKLGHSPRAFSYPFGDVDGPVQKIVAGAGFSCGCASGNGFVRPDADADAFALPRIAVGDCDASVLEQRLAGR